MISGLAIAVCTLGPGCAGPAPDVSQPNIALIYIDDLGWRDLGVQGSTFYDTPRIDRLAAEGIRFTQGYANAPNCAPSRASLLTGLYTPRHGIYSVATNARGRSSDRALLTAPDLTTLDTSFVTLAEGLRNRGYTTGFVGKWHLGGDGALPVDHGFDIAVAGDASGTPAAWFAPYRGRTRDVADLAGTGADGEYLTDRLTDEALSFLDGQRDGPWFLMLSHYAVHTPIRADSARIRRFQGRAPSEGHGDPTYAAMIAAVDESVGRILDRVEVRGETDRTIVVFTSDNGGYGPITSMTPLRGAKGMLYEGGIRVPLIVRWPGVSKAGSVNATPVIGLDLFTTLLSAAGGDAQMSDGVDLHPIVEGLDGPERALFWHFPAYLEAYRGTDGLWRTTPVSVIRHGRWKLLHYFEGERKELYDLVADPGESRDLALEEPDTAARLLADLEAWWTRTGAFVPRTANPEFVPPNRPD